MKRAFFALLAAGCCHVQPPLVRTVIQEVRTPCLGSLGAPPTPKSFTTPTECLPGKVCWEPRALSTYQSNYENLESWASAAWSFCKPSQ